jgi:hypothetical protein
MHEIATSSSASLRGTRRIGRSKFIQSNAAIGNVRKSIEPTALVWPGAVVATVKAITEFPLPAPTCEGLKVQVERFGRFEQENATLLGKLAVVGFTSSV